MITQKNGWAPNPSYFHDAMKQPISCRKLKHESSSPLPSYYTDRTTSARHRLYLSEVSIKSTTLFRGPFLHS